MWRSFALITIVLILAGCGQKGELYRPDSQDNQTAATFSSNQKG